MRISNLQNSGSISGNNYNYVLEKDVVPMTEPYRSYYSHGTNIYRVDKIKS